MSTSTNSFDKVGSSLSTTFQETPSVKIYRINEKGERVLKEVVSPQKYQEMKKNYASEAGKSQGMTIRYEQKDFSDNRSRIEYRQPDNNGKISVQKNYKEFFVEEAVEKEKMFMKKATVKESENPVPIQRQNQKIERDIEHDRKRNIGSLMKSSSNSVTTAEIVKKPSSIYKGQAKHLTRSRKPQKISPRKTDMISPRYIREPTINLKNLPEKSQKQTKEIRQQSSVEHDHKFYYKNQQNWSENLTSSQYRNPTDKQKREALSIKINMFVNRRKSYAFQLLKQFILFPDDSWSEVSSLTPLDRLILDDQIQHNMRKIYETLEMEQKMWAFLNLKFWPMVKKLTQFTYKVSTATQKFQTRITSIQKKQSFQGIFNFANKKKQSPKKSQSYYSSLTNNIRAISQQRSSIRTKPGLVYSISSQQQKPHQSSKIIRHVQQLEQRTYEYRPSYRYVREQTSESTRKPEYQTRIYYSQKPEEYRSSVSFQSSGHCCCCQNQNHNGVNRNRNRRSHVEEQDNQNGVHQEYHYYYYGNPPKKQKQTHERQHESHLHQFGQDSMKKAQNQRNNANSIAYYRSLSPTSEYDSPKSYRYGGNQSRNQRNVRFYVNDSELYRDQKPSQETPKSKLKNSRHSSSQNQELCKHGYRLKRSSARSSKKSDHMESRISYMQHLEKSLDQRERKSYRESEREKEIERQKDQERQKQQQRNRVYLQNQNVGTKTGETIYSRYRYQEDRKDHGRTSSCAPFYAK